jgi:hypothetical protein
VRLGCASLAVVLALRLWRLALRLRASLVCGSTCVSLAVVLALQLWLLTSAPHVNGLRLGLRFAVGCARVSALVARNSAPHFDGVRLWCASLAVVLVLQLWLLAIQLRASMVYGFACALLEVVLALRPWLLALQLRTSIMCGSNLSFADIEVHTCSRTRTSTPYHNMQLNLHFTSVVLALQYRTSIAT